MNPLAQRRTAEDAGASSLDTERPDTGDEPRHDLVWKVELGHPALAILDRPSDLVVLDLVLPIATAEVGGSEHGPLRTVALTQWAVASRALIAPCDLDEGGRPRVALR